MLRFWDSRLLAQGLILTVIRNLEEFSTIFILVLIIISGPAIAPIGPEINPIVNVLGFLGMDILVNLYQLTFLFY